MSNQKTISGGHMKNEITVTEKQINLARLLIEETEFPNWFDKGYIANFLFDNMSDFAICKVRKAIEILISRGYKILPHDGGYSMWSEDPKPVREYLNKEYHKLTESKKKLDAMYHTFRETFGNEEAAKVEVMPGQPAFDGFIDITKDVITPNDRYKVFMFTGGAETGEAQPNLNKSFDAGWTLHNV